MLLEVSGLHTYYASSHALQGVDFHVAPGEIVALMGRNGMGKSTLLRSILGHVRPQSGDVRIDGASTLREPPHRVARRGVAYVPEGRGIFPNLSVRENLVMAARGAGDARDPWSLRRVLDAFPRLGARLDHRGSQLSGGEQQMLSVGRALMTNPRLLFVDEATEGLAPLVARDIWTILRTIRATGISAVIVDKNVGALSHLADRCVILVKGRKVFDATPDVLAAQHDVRMQYLGV